MTDDMPVIQSQDDRARKRGWGSIELVPKPRYEPTRAGRWLLRSYILFGAVGLAGAVFDASTGNGSEFSGWWGLLGALVVTFLIAWAIFYFGPPREDTIWLGILAAWGLIYAMQRWGA